MPTIHKLPRKSLPAKNTKKRDKELWEKHKASKNKPPLKK